jgi:hypothetical protein
MMFLPAAIMNFCFGYLDVNEVVGKAIDADEAQYYRIFTDVPEFESARFVENGDSILVEINTLNGDVHETRYRNIDSASYVAIDRYIKYFQRIVEDPPYRRRFIENNKIGWPVLSEREFAMTARTLNDRRTFNNTNCMTSISSGSAYAGGLLGRRVTRVVSGCTYTYYYSVNPLTCIGVTAGGTLAGYLVMPKEDASKAIDLALQKDILAFDLYQRPITAGDCLREKNNFNQNACTGMGTILGLISSAATFYLMAIPYFFYSPNTDWDMAMTIAPMVVFSISELTAIINFSNEHGNKEDIKATIEKIKQKRIKENKEK